MNHLKQNHLIRLACLMIMITIGLAAPAWAGDEPGPEITIFAKIKLYIQASQELEACRLVDGELSKYKDTPTYAEAQKYLRAHGISIDDALGSYTAKKLVQLQNDTEAKRMAEKGLPDPGPRPRYKDAWGKPVRIELVSRGGFIYLVRSAGPDGVYMNSDDYVVGTRADRPIDQGLSAPKLKKSASQAARSSLYRRGSKPPKPGLGMNSSDQQSSGKNQKLPVIPETKNGEAEVSLDDLLQK